MQSGVSGAEPWLDLREVLDMAGDIVYCLDLHGRFTYFNRAASEVFQIPAREAPEWLGRSFGELLTPASQGIAMEHFQRGVDGKEITPFFEVEGVRRDGSLVQLEIRASAVRREGEVVGRLGIARDITELKRLQAEIRTKSERLGLLEAQNRVAMDIYRRLAQLNLGEPANADATDGALRRVSEILAETSAAQLGLGTRDVEIIQLVARGRSNREIAAAVFLSSNTVKDRISKIMRALGVGSRAEVVAEATRRGLITLAD